jgi:hypothetical protein
MKTNSNTVRYGVSDLGQAAALVCKGFEIIDFVPDSRSRRVTFYFKDKNIDTVARMYWAGTLTVDSKQFWNEMKNIKTRLYSLR